MAREGGSYIRNKDGSLKLVHRTQPAGTKTTEAVKPAETKSEVSTNENEE